MPQDRVQAGRISRRASTQPRRRQHDTSYRDQRGSATVPTEPNEELLVDSNSQIVGNVISEQASRSETLTAAQEHQNIPAAAAAPSMTPKEREWWAMTFDELYKDATSKGYGKTGTEGRKSGRVRIIKWLCEDEGITPYVAPTITHAAEATPATTRPVIRTTGAIAHPEAILRTSDPALQRAIEGRETQYLKWKHANLVELAMERSYQLLKDSNAKLPSRSISALSKWLAAWDILKSDREKNWWLGDGIDLANRAKAMGYQGSSTKKYDVILWLRTTPEDCELTEIAEPTPNGGPTKRKLNGTVETVSKRPAKGSKRPNGWNMLRHP